MRGTVQGVGYRDACRREALGLGVSGWVRNGTDGTVEAVFEGAPRALDDLLRWCRQGPTRAAVRGVVVEVSAPVGEIGFRVLD